MRNTLILFSFSILLCFNLSAQEAKVILGRIYQLVSDKEITETITGRYLFYDSRRQWGNGGSWGNIDSEGGDMFLDKDGVKMTTEMSGMLFTTGDGNINGTVPKSAILKDGIWYKRIDKDYNIEYAYYGGRLLVDEMVFKGGQWHGDKTRIIDRSESVMRFCFDYGEGLWYYVARNGHLCFTKNGRKPTPVSVEIKIKDFLQTVFPNIIEDDFTTVSWQPYATERFKEHCVECDYDPVYKTQDCYSAGILPNPVYSKFSSYPNAYRVSWQRYERKENVSVIVVLKNENGKILIDNIYTGSSHPLLFDYSKPAVPFWE